MEKSYSKRSDAPRSGRSTSKLGTKGTKRPSRTASGVSSRNATSKSTGTSRGTRKSDSYESSSRGNFASKGERSFKSERSYNTDRKPSFNKRFTKTTEPKRLKAKVDDGLVRLNKFIANSGVCSRREADTFIKTGLVTVNGTIVTDMGVKVDPQKDDIRFSGERLKGEKAVYIVMNKPKNFVTTLSDSHAERIVIDLISKEKCPERVFPVGRLDKATTGVLMFTNDGNMAEKLTHPAYQVRKIYQVTLDKNLKKADFDAILEGFILDDGEIHADALSYIDGEQDVIGIEIHSGRNRIVRRIFEHFGYKVRKLDRVYFAGLTKKNLKRGEWRFLTEKEVSLLKMGAFE